MAAIAFHKHLQLNQVQYAEYRGDYSEESKVR